MDHKYDHTSLFCPKPSISRERHRLNGHLDMPTTTLQASRHELINLSIYNQKKDYFVGKNFGSSIEVPGFQSNEYYINFITFAV